MLTLRFTEPSATTDLASLSLSFDVDAAAARVALKRIGRRKPVTVVETDGSVTLMSAGMVRSVAWATWKAN